MAAPKMPENALKVDVADIVPEFVELMAQIGGRAFRNAYAALDTIAQLYHQAWLGFASGVPIPGTPRVINSRGAYKRSIRLDLSNDNQKVVYADGRITGFIESGHGVVDLKPGLLRGPKARTSKSGDTYNIVAFRHDTPSGNANPMPLSVYRLARQLAQSTVTSTGVGKAMTAKMRQSGMGVNERNTYSWGGRLQAEGIGKQSKLVSRLIKGAENYTWKKGKYEGMVRMATSTGKALSSGYITFRVVSAHSDPSSWILPALAPVPIRRAVVDEVRDLAEEELKKALEKDLA